MALNATDFNYLAAYVKTSTAIVLTPDKDYLVESRLSPVARRMGVSTVSDLVGILRKSPSPASEVGQLISEAMTTNETYFFRDVKPFDVLKKSLLPDAIERRNEARTLNIWSAACSSGQESYSILMTIKEHFPALSSWRIRLFATDISKSMVERTREGIYSQIEMNRGLPATMLVKYFTKSSSEWRIKPELTKLVEASTMNLAGSWPVLPQMDIVFLRNVLIYFDLETKRSILKKVVNSMATNATLLLGGSESTMNVSDDFERLPSGDSFFYRLKEGARQNRISPSNAPWKSSAPTMGARAR